MILELKNLPDNEPIPKPKVVDLVNLIEEKYQSQIDYMEEQNRLLRNELFGRKSEKDPEFGHNQIPLFPQSNDQHEEPIVIPSHKRNKRGRKPLPAHLPRVGDIQDLNEDEKMCGCGQQMTRIGQEESEKLDYIPAKIQVIRLIRYKYACKSCEGVESDGPSVKIAPLPA